MPLPTHHEVEDYIRKYYDIINGFDIVLIQKEIQELELVTQKPDFWDDPEKAAKIQTNIAHKMSLIEDIEVLKRSKEDLFAAIELGAEEEYNQSIKKLDNIYEDIEKNIFLNGKWDNEDCVMSIQSGAGGVDSEDFAAMLLNMYQAFCKYNNFKPTILSLSSGSEGGVKSAEVLIKGTFAYGLMKEEAGVHRLIRLSPFNSGNTRETSFASVEVLPNGLDKELDFELDEKDLKIDTYLSSGKGGQGVNTTYSAVRITHIPTKLVATCQNERSQIQNRQIAMEILKNRVAHRMLEAQKNMINNLKDIKKSADFGAQIRTYTLHPYKLVKDTRSKHEESDVESVLNGEKVIDFIWSVKRMKNLNNKESK